MPRRQISTWIRLDLLAKMDLLLTDPTRNKVRYAARTEYLEDLIEKDLGERQRKQEEELPGGAKSFNYEPGNGSLTLNGLRCAACDKEFSIPGNEGSKIICPHCGYDHS
jgi:hypothetical protein